MYLHGAMATNMKEDVYESEEPLTEADRDQKYFRDELTLPEELQLVHLDIDGALKRFQGRLLNAQNVDFSDSISPLGKKSYGSVAYVLEIQGKNSDEPETFEQKFQRLHMEIGELAQCIPTGKDEAVTTKSTSLLKSMLDEVKARKDVAKPTKGDQTAKIPGPSQADGNVKSLEKRLARIESLTGHLPAGAQPLTDAIEDLRLRTDVLNPAFMETADSKLVALLNKLKQVEEKKGNSNEEIEQNVNELLALMSKWDGVCANLPSKTKKLNSLSRLHECAQQFSERLNRLSNTREMIEKEILKNRTNLDFVHTMAKNEVAALVAKIETLEGHLKKMEK
ncbi:unnamed protein product, partial [Mesorhabditis belari]|uniref:Dynactin subunit 2 n=1 Tax=Mesorhabditis belari TaxID=2138241 RepID=A0AAF3FRJ2_9BILA